MTKHEANIRIIFLMHENPERVVGNYVEGIGKIEYSRGVIVGTATTIAVFVIVYLIILLC